MVINSQVLNYIYSSDFSHTIYFLRERKPRVPVKTLLIIHLSEDNANFRYSQRKLYAIFELLSAITENSLTHLERVYHGVQRWVGRFLRMRLTRH